MIKAIYYQNSYSPEKGKLVAWATYIMKNVYIDQIRKERRRSNVHLADVFEEPKSFDPQFDMTVDNQLDQMYAAIDQLNPEIKEVLDLRLESVPYREISERLQITEGDARAKYHRAKRKLRQIMKV